MIRLVAFDLDGTLIDSLGDISASANDALAEAYGESARLSLEQVRGFVGRGARELIERCVAAAGKRPEDVAKIFDRFMTIYGSRLTETTRLYEGLEGALDRIGASVPLAVLTNKPGDMSRSILAGLGLADRFIAVIGGDDLASRKPDPEGLLKIVAQAGVRPEETALVGDSAVDIRTARRAGALAVGVMWGYDRPGVASEGPDVSVEKAEELAPLLLRSEF